MTVIKVSLVWSFALLYEVAVKVTRILHVDFNSRSERGVKKLPLITFTEEKKYKILLFLFELDGLAALNE